MSAGLPETLDAWRALAAGRSFTGKVPLRAMPRLCEALQEPDGDCEYALSFGRGALNLAHVEIVAQARLPLLCQRSLQRFLLPVAVAQKLALLSGEGQEASLPEGYEALVLAADGLVRPLDLIEDELILALPVVAIDVAAAPLDAGVMVATDAGAATDTRENPFAVLANIKHHKQRDPS